MVHDWLTGTTGREKVLESLSQLFPGADLFTLVYQPEKVSSVFQKHRVTTSPLQRLPFGKTRYPHFLPLYWNLMGSFDLSGYDLIVSSSSACAKWVRNPKKVPHVCYCHTPLREIWDEAGSLETQESFGAPLSARFFRSYLQRCDLKSNEGVTRFLTNSNGVKERIARLYGREAEVIPPPLDLDRYTLPKGPGEYFLVVSDLEPSNRVDLAVKVCGAHGWPLIVVGQGSDRKRLQAMAGSSVKFQGAVSEEELPVYYSQAKALIFAGWEDFPMAPLEALGAGCPVVAFNQVGARETLEEGVTGVLFNERKEESLEGALRRFEKGTFDSEVLRKKAAPFSKKRFFYKAKLSIRSLMGIQTTLEDEAAS
ncbi:MAG TPA: glycosyltransferase [bacterium]